MTTKLGFNLQVLRKSIEGGISQDEMAKRLSLSKSTYGSYEQDRTEPKLVDILRIAEYFKVSADELLSEDLSILPRKKEGLRILATTVNSENKDNIEFVPIKALGGYKNSFGDLEFITSLPTFHLPFLDSNKKYRTFPYQGESMLPLREGSFVFGEYIEDWISIKNGTICILVTKDEGVVVKMVFNYLKDKQILILKPINTAFDPYPVQVEDISEIWKFAGYFHSEFPN
ncbi:MAG: helix-turn-helix domain-containing protein [Bacteroidota bacterium]